MRKIKIGILGYGNLGKGVELQVNKTEDMELVGIFTRRDNIKTVSGVKSYNISELSNFSKEIDVLILCGGSATDLPVQGVKMLENFNTVDSFDTHAKIPEYFDAMDIVGKKSGKLGIISVGWDPGLFSIARCLFESVLPNGENYTFWGKGVSQGHSDAIRRIAGVANGIQYTIPKKEAMELVESGLRPQLTVRDKHLRECYVVLAEGANKELIEKTIVNMPNYFEDYDTTVHFISEAELLEKHSGMPHGGSVLRSGVTGNDVNNFLGFSLKLDSNPQFTGGVLVAYARAIFKLSKEGRTGALTVLDVPISYLSSCSKSELRKKLL